MTLKNFGVSTIASVSAALFILFENAIACQSRLILLDSSLIFFIAFTAMMWSRFLSVQSKPFSFEWWSTLLMTGIGLGLAVSVKFVGISHYGFLITEGLFIIATVGIETLKNLWDLFGDIELKKVIL
jgi:dolichyl-phosphate-mannose-protein mannosyltransferase